jgi:CRISPR/Cas system-associated endonuclease Cas3-HD
MKPEFTKGGRSKIAPYETTHVRVPKILKSWMIQVSDQYKQSLEDGTNIRFLDNLHSFSSQQTTNRENLETLAEKVLKLRRQKKSTKDALDNLLTAILGEI